MAAVPSSRIAARAARWPGWALSFPINPCMGGVPPEPWHGNAAAATSAAMKPRRSTSGAARLDEAQGHPVALADGLVPGPVGRVVAVARWQGPHAIGVVLGVARVGVDLAAGIQLESGGLGQRDHLRLADITAAVVLVHIGGGAVFHHAQHATGPEHLVERLEHARC